MINKKVIKILSVVLLVICITSLSVSKAAPNSLTVNLNGIMNYLTFQDSSGGNMGGAWAKVNSGSTILYCMENEKSWPTSNMTYNLTSSLDDKGLVYILENGYNGINNKTIVDGGDKDRYITQAAIWLYLKGSLGTYFESAADPEGLKPHMKQLAQEAREVKNGTRSYESTTSTSVNFNNPNTLMTLSTDETRYVSSVIKPTITKATTYTVSASGVSGIKIQNESGEEKTSFNSNEGFVISVPTDSVEESSNINVNVSATGEVSYVKQT